MGSGESKTQKVVDTRGTVNNNVVVTADHTMEKTQILVLILCILKTIEYLYLVYISHQRRLKKRYASNIVKPIPNQGNNNGNPS